MVFLVGKLPPAEPDPLGRSWHKERFMAAPRTALVVSAHAADFVWRCGGAIALHAQKGFEVTVVCLSFGERGESAKLWKHPGMTLDEVKRVRRAEAENAAAALGVHNLVSF